LTASVPWLVAGASGFARHGPAQVTLRPTALKPPLPRPSGIRPRQVPSCCPSRQFESCRQSENRFRMR
jgi:hypothetical protein